MLKRSEKLIRILEGTRCIGKTSEAIRLAKKVNGTVICMNDASANRESRRGKVKTASINSLDRLAGDPNPIILDPDAYLEILKEVVKPLAQDDMRQALEELIGVNLGYSLTSKNKLIREIAQTLVEE